MAVEPHEWCEGKIDNENTKTNRKQEQGFVFFGNGQVYEKQADPPHDDELIMKTEKPGLCK